MSQGIGNMRTRMNLRFFLSAIVALLAAATAARAEVVTVLSRDSTRVGQPVVLVYRFINTEQPQDMPDPAIMVDGLDIRFQGASRQNNFSFSFGSGGGQNRSESLLEYTYAVIPLRSGEFTIPGFEVRVGGKTLRTKPARLMVVGAGGVRPPAMSRQSVPPAPSAGQALPLPQVPPPPAPTTGEGGEAYFGEMLMTSKPVYVGEIVPVDIRFYFRGDLPLNGLQQPSFGGDGFTAVPLGEPQQSELVVGNIPYRVFTFRSAVTAVKTGEIEIPPVKMGGQIMVPGAPAGFDALFDQFFRNFPMPGIGRAENIEVRTQGRTLKVLPLPKDGRPANFGGAIGQFSIEASSAPASAGPGEPVKLSLAVSGRGNFDAMSPPVLDAADGWRTYAPKDNFQNDDLIGFSGTKTFEFKMVALSDQNATPGASFSYFDPRKKEYITLTADPQPVNAAGRKSSTSGEDSRGTDGASKAAEDAGVPSQEPLPVDDISAPAVALSGGVGRNFTPDLFAPWFRTTNLLLLVIALFVLPLLLWWRRHRIKSARAVELERAVREANSALRKASDRTEFYNAAARFVQARLELHNGHAGTVSDASAELHRHTADASECQDLQSVLARHDELKYGGGTGGALGGEERRHVLALLEKFAAQK